jgi:hypothetical protein
VAGVRLPLRLAAMAEHEREAAIEALMVTREEVEALKRELQAVQAELRPRRARPHIDT